MELEQNNISKRQPGTLDKEERALLAHIQNGLPITERPYQAIASQMGIPEEDVLNRIAKLRDQGLIKRFGVVVRHHELGYKDNAMIVWDVPDEEIHTIGRLIKSFPFVTLCYRRARQLPEWPYNLFCMIHGKNREEVLQNLQTMIATSTLDYRHEILFSKRRFKQRAANYIPSYLRT